MKKGMTRRDFMKGAAGLTGAASLGMLIGCSTNSGKAGESSAETTKAPTTAAEAATTAAAAEQQADEVKAPKYIFLFIGDGMSYPQVQSTAYYNGAMNSEGGVEISPVSFMGFPVIGSQYTYDSTSFCPDSASTATSIASGEKTYSGVINVDTTKTKKFETIAEKLKKQKNYKIGVLSSVNLNHATPAAFYAHQESRKNYYEIGEELISSEFDYFAGGGLLKPTGSDKDKEDLYERAEKAGYKVIKTYEEAEALKAGEGKAILVAETLADGDAMNYEMDAAEGEWLLSDYVKKGIEMLEDAEDGFFLMCEGGKIDWACHANDAKATMTDVMALDTCVKATVEFYEAHPDETLILVTGDHETGGLTIGYAETNYDTFLCNMDKQKISYVKFDEEYVDKYVENKATFEEVLTDVQELFGLMTAEAAEAAGIVGVQSAADLAAAQKENKNASTLVLTEDELADLRAAYERELAVGAGAQADMTQAEYVHYGTYRPFSVTLTHLLNHKSGVDFATYAHSGVTVPVFAKGCGADVFDGFYDNTDIYKKMAELTGVK